MRFNIYGRFQLDLRRENDAWEVYRLEPGTQVSMSDVVIPSMLEAGEIAIYLDDIFHELSGPGGRIELMS